VATVVLAALEGTAGLWLSVETNAPPGATIAVLGGAVFVAAALARLLAGRVAIAGAALAALALVVGGCASAGGSGGKPVVVGTTTQLADFARAVGGPDVAVHGILRPNTDPHEYEPRPSDVQQTANARVVLESGDGLDKWMGKVVSQSGGSPTVVDVSKSVPIHRKGDTSATDPHWWHDPRNAEAAIVEIRNAFVKADPAHRAGFERRAAAYIARLRALDSGIGRCFASVPAGERKIVTDHDAFGYFAARYGIKVVGAVIKSQSTQGQPSAGEVNRLVGVIRREHVRAIFPESSVSPKLERAIARATGASSGYTLYGDTLGPKGSAGETYLKMEAANADSILRGITGGARGCQVP
jgi:ABC-type Zn uptake system ZnuABC Zn-binding protein ZnuA